MNKYHVAWWNVENLFDIEESPDRPDWLRRKLAKELKDWDAAVLAKKISQLASIVMKMNQNTGPDLLGVCEIENKRVLELLVQAVAPLDRNYGIAHHDTSDKRGIDVAFIYDRDLFSAQEQFSHVILKRGATRDLFQVNFDTTAGNRLIVIGNHWPSRMSGTYETEPYRILAAETLSYWMLRMEEELGANPPPAVVILGDFNDEPPSRSMTQYALSSRNRLRVTNARTPRLFNLMWPLLGTERGTYFYNGWAVLDQFLVSRGFLEGPGPFTLGDDPVQVYNFPEMVSGDYKKPTRFGRPSKKNGFSPETGYSDHFPIGMTIVEET